MPTCQFGQINLPVFSNVKNWLNQTIRLLRKQLACPMIEPPAVGFELFSFLLRNIVVVTQCFRPATYSGWAPQILCNKKIGLSENQTANVRLRAPKLPFYDMSWSVWDSNRQNTVSDTPVNLLWTKLAGCRIEPTSFRLGHSVTVLWQNCLSGDRTANIRLRALGYFASKNNPYVRVSSLQYIQGGHFS